MDHLKPETEIQNLKQKQGPHYHFDLFFFIFCYPTGHTSSTTWLYTNNVHIILVPYIYVKFIAFMAWPYFIYLSTIHNNLKIPPPGMCIFLVSDSNFTTNTYLYLLRVVYDYAIRFFGAINENWTCVINKYNKYNKFRYQLNTT